MATAQTLAATAVDQRRKMEIMMRALDINCDMGEGMETDAAIMPYITSASIACGYHAGDEKTILQTILLAQQYQVRIGAHISFEDRENFGRKEMELSDAAVFELVKKQLLIFKRIASDAGSNVYHVKPHGALYNMSARKKELAAIIATAIKETDPALVLYGLSGSHSITEAARIGLKVAQEAFADRSYQDDGSLTSRSQPGSVYQQAEQVIAQVSQLAKEQKLTTVSGKTIPVKADTICVHGDGIHAVEFAKAIATEIRNNHTAYEK